MDELIKTFVANLPYAGIFLLLLVKVYQDWASDREKAQLERDKLLAIVIDNKQRLERIEFAVFGERFPTSGKRPTDTSGTPL